MMTKCDMGEGVKNVEWPCEGSMLCKKFEKRKGKRDQESREDAYKV